MDTSFAFLGIDPVRAFDALAPLLPADYEALAVAHRQVQTQFGNAKITTASELLRFVFAYAGANRPLRYVTAEMEAAGAARLSAMRLHMKLRQAAPYLHALCQRMVPAREALAPELWRGFELVHVASTCVVGAASTQPPERLHVATALFDARVDATAISDPSERDALRQFFWAPKQLAVALDEDVSAASVARVRAQGAHVLVELGGEGALHFVDDVSYGGGVDVAAFRRQAARRRDVLARDVRLVVRDPAKRVEGRLVAFRRGLPCPPPSGPRLVEPAAAGLDVAAFFTTAPEATLDADAVRDVAERAAVVATALGGWRRAGARLSNQRGDTTLAWVYARVLLGLLEERLAHAAA